MLEELKKMKIGKIIPCPQMKDYTTYKAGGRALAIIIPSSVDDLVNVITYLKTKQIQYKILGNGSNLIFVNDTYNGVLIKLSAFDDVKITGNKVVVGAGYSLMKLAMKTAKLGLTGLEFASGIPGTVGGGVFMNAGAYQSDMGYVVRSIRVLTPDLKVETMYNKNLDFHYRTSFLQTHPGYICLEATMMLKKGKAEAILQLIKERRERRLVSQPLEYPSAGSVFRNPENDYAGRLIEELGYKGKGIGDAIVSEKHANFIINKGHASGKDIKKLIMEIQAKVKEKYGIELKLEQEFVE